MSIHLKLLVASVFWGTTPSVGRLLAEYEAPFAVVFGRFLIAGLCLGAFAATAGALRPLPRRGWLRFALLGVTGIALHNGLMFKGLESTQASTASILLGLIAILVLLLDVAIYRRVPDRWALLGVALGFSGTATVITDGALWRVTEIGFGVGEVLILASALCWALYSVIGREALERDTPLLVTTLATWAGVLVLAPAVIADLPAAAAVFADPRALVFVALLGVVGSALGFLWYAEAVERHGAVSAALYINLVPIFGVASAALLVGEQPRPSVLLGVVLVVGGIALVNRPSALAPSVVQRPRSTA